MKKLFLISLLVCVGILQSLANNFDYTDERGVTWSCSETDYNYETQSYTSAYIASVTGYGDEVVIPEKVYDGTKEYTVTSIQFTFQDNDILEKVTWPSTLTEIPYQMFMNCSRLKTVENIREVKSIGYSAFQNCYNLIELDLGSCEIVDWAFSYCSKLQSIGDLAKCTSVGNDAFYGCSSLEKIDLSMCTSFGSSAFWGCSSLQAIGNPKFTSIPDYAFNGCSNLEKVDLSMCTSVGSSAFWGCSSLQAIGNPKFTSIPNNAFNGCSNLENIDLSLCTSVGSDAFKGCSKLQNVNISNCTYIGSGAFNGCSSMTEVDLSSCKSMNECAFSGCKKLENVIGLENLKSIPERAFCVTALKSVNLPVCTTIGSFAFNNCSSITEVDLSACENMGNGTFLGCNKLVNAIGLENLKSIPDGAFRGTALKSVKLPVCTTIGGEAFSDCSSLQSVDLPVCTTIGSSAFYGCSGLQSVDLPVCTTIGSSAFYGCSGLQSVDLLACTTIDSYAFSACSGLQTVDLPTCMTISEGAFSNCSGLQSVVLSVCTTIGEGAFSGCSDLQSVDLPKVESIGSSAFVSSGITKVSLPGTLKNMGYRCFDTVTEYTFNGTQPAVLYEDNSYFAFYGATFVIRVPESAIDTYKAADVWKNYKDKIFSISDQLYYDVTTTAMDSQSGLEQAIGATNMKKVISLKATGTINGYDIFMIRTKMANLHYLDLTDADIVANGFAYYENNSTTDNVVGSYSFYNLNNLVTLKLPKNAITIDNDAVAFCSSLESVDFPKNLKNIGVESFQNCEKLDNVFLPDGLESIEYSSFNSCI